MIARSAAYRPDVPSKLTSWANGSSFFPPRSAETRAADRPPRGRVLIVESHFPIAFDLQKTLRDAGYRIVGPAGSQSEVERLVRRGGLDAAVIDADSRQSAPFAVADWLASAGVPFAFLVSDASSLPHEHAFGHAHRPQISKPWSTAALVDTVDQLVAGAPGAVVLPPARWPRHFPTL
jgi:DNA-binding NarL/FixJ family response regulator